MSPSGPARLAFRRVFARPGYVFLAAAVAAFAYSLTAWLPNLALIGQVFSSAEPLAEKIGLLLSLWRSIFTSFGWLSIFNVVAGSLLFGVSVSLAVFALRKRAAVARSLGAGAAGVLAGVLGLGCGACGSLVLTALLPALAATGILPLLPFHGAEIGTLGVLLQLLAAWLLLRSVGRSPVCRV